MILDMISDMISDIISNEVSDTITDMICDIGVDWTRYIQQNILSCAHLLPHIWLILLVSVYSINLINICLSRNSLPVCYQHATIILLPGYYHAIVLLPGVCHTTTIHCSCNAAIILLSYYYQSNIMLILVHRM